MEVHSLIEIKRFIRIEYVDQHAQILRFWGLCAFGVRDFMLTTNRGLNFVT